MSMTRRTLLSAAAATAATAAMALPRAQAETGKTPDGSRMIRVKDGTELFVRDIGGSGRPVVMTHAWPVNADVWDYQVSQLSLVGFRVITFDRRGFGRSGKPDSAYDFDILADDLATVIEQSGVRDGALVGYSMGGGEVIRYFSRHGGRGITKAGLVAGATPYLLKTADNPIGLDKAVFDGIKQGVLGGDRKAYFEGLFRNVVLDEKRPATHPVTQELIDASVASAMQASPTALAACVDTFSLSDLRGELAKVTVRTLVIHGTADVAVPIALGRAAAAGIRGATLVELEGASHGLVVTERERVTNELAAFLVA